MEGSSAPTEERPLPDLSVFDPTDRSWWKWREMGAPDDPYNNIPKLKPEDPEYKEYSELAQSGWDHIVKEYEAEEGWVFCKEEEGVTIHTKDQPDDPVRSVRGVGIIPASSEVLRLHLVQMDLRFHWDEMFLGAKYHLEVTPNIRVAYYSFKAPWPVNNRDFLTVAGETLTEDNLFVSAVNSIEREDFPEQEGFVRAILRNSGFVVKPIENDENGKPRCKVTYVVSMNPMGWIPTWVVNMVNVAQPMCINTLKNAILLTEVLIAEGLRKLEALPEEECKAANLRRLTNKVIDAHNGKQEMLWEPLQYIITGKRQPEEDVTEVMEREGKEKCMAKMWRGSMPYLQSVADKELNAMAEKALRK
jgi:hypothetical protein